MACKATWQRHAAPTRHDATYLYLLIYVIICIAFHLSGGIINPLNTSHLLNPMPSLNFLRVGRSSMELFFMQMMWPLAVRRIGSALEIHASIA